MKSPTTNFIALASLVIGAGLVMWVFSLSRNDPGLRMAALVAATTAGGSLIAIASTLLTGKDITRPEPTELPPGFISRQMSTVEVPPTQPVPPAETK